MTTDAIAEIDRLKAELDDLRPLPSDATGRLAQKLRIEWNYHSNAIEGNALTLGETRTLILHGLTARGKPMRDHLDIEGHDDAVKAIEEAVGEGDALNQAFIRNLHSILLKEPYEMPAESPDGHRTMRPISVGQYKTMPNNVRTQTGEMHYFAPPDQVQSMMSDLIDWCRAKEAEGEHAIVIAATFHYRFVQIHPFDDGNGRMARLLTNLILMRHGYTIAMVQRDGRDRYIAEIEQAQATGSLAGFIATSRNPWGVPSGGGAQATGSLAGFIAYIAECCRYSLELHLRAARGESIEEPDDIDREIAVFKRSMVAASGEDDLIPARQLAEEVVFPLFQYFERKAMGFATYFASHSKGGRAIAVGADGETTRKSADALKWLRKLPRTARSLRCDSIIELSEFQASDRYLYLTAKRTDDGTWRFALEGYLLDRDEVTYVGDDLDELKKRVNDIIRRLMAVLNQWKTQPGAAEADASE